jgi:hypothetical protein
MWVWLANAVAKMKVTCIMPEQLVTVAAFVTPGEADLAKNRLEEAGISAHLQDADTVGWLWHMSIAVGGVKVQVAESDAAQALSLLTRDAETSPSEGEQDASTHTAIQAAWPCSRCGSPVNPVALTCPACGAPANDLQELTPPSPTAISTVRPADEEDEKDEEDEDSDTTAANQLAARAYKAAIFGLVFCPPLFQTYSIWLLIQLATFSGELGQAATRKMCVAIAVDCAVVAWTLVLYSFWIRLFLFFTLW